MAWGYGRAAQYADDSSGSIGDMAEELLAVHARACTQTRPDPMKLARWLVRFAMDDQNFFTIDVRYYASALGENGLAAYGGGHPPAPDRPGQVRSPICRRASHAARPRHRRDHPTVRRRPRRPHDHARRSQALMEVTASRFAHQRAGLLAVRDLLPDAEPCRAWANLGFIGDDGSANEVDLLVLARNGLHLIELKHRVARDKASKTRVPFVRASVLPHVPDVSVALDPAGRTGVYATGGTGLGDLRALRDARRGRFRVEQGAGAVHEHQILH